MPTHNGRLLLSADASGAWKLHALLPLRSVLRAAKGGVKTAGAGLVLAPVPPTPTLASRPGIAPSQSGVAGTAGGVAGGVAGAGDGPSSPFAAAPSPSPHPALLPLAVGAAVGAVGPTSAPRLGLTDALGPVDGAATGAATAALAAAAGRSQQLPGGPSRQASLLKESAPLEMPGYREIVAAASTLLPALLPHSRGDALDVVSVRLVDLQLLKESLR